jgi:hypothetical protein
VFIKFLIGLYNSKFMAPSLNKKYRNTIILRSFSLFNNKDFGRSLI